MTECTCFVTGERYWFRYGSAVEPGSQMEPNPECPVHFPEETCIESLLEQSSLGTPEARALRASVSDERAAAILRRAGIA